MKILKLNIMRGPNYWSNYRKHIIVLKLDLEEFDEITTDKIEGFSTRLKTLIPSLYEHGCSFKEYGGFLKRLEEGTLLGHVLEHVALELQTLAGMDVGYGRARKASEPRVYNVIFSYRNEKAGIRAAEIAFEIIETLARQKDYLYLEESIAELKEIWANEKLGPSTEAIIAEAASRKIPVTIIKDAILMLGYGAKQKLISATITSDTSCLGTDIASDKNLTKTILESQYIPVPKGEVVFSLEEMNEAIDKIGFPIAIKPRFGNHGRGITTNINTKEKADIAFKHAKKESNSVVIERFIPGYDYRFLVINYKVVGVALRVPAMVMGNGVSTIEELIIESNKHPHRGKMHENLLTSIAIDESTLSILAEKGLNLQCVLPKNQTLHLKHTANISTGGTAIDVTDDVHPHNIFLAERIARLMRLDVCGIDVIAKDIQKPLTEKNGGVLEVNASPGFRMHLNPMTGQPRNVAKEFIDMLFTPNNDARIPLIAVTGTNGKTTVVRLISHIARCVGKNVGMATTEGLYINNELIYRGDCSGPTSAIDILRDPLVDFAVIECARGGIIRAGLGFDHCSVSIVTNISEDHLGIDDIHTLDQLTQVKSVVPHSTLENGYAILNAENENVYNMKKDLHCNIALFSLTRNKHIIEHGEAGHVACFLDEDYIYLTEKGSPRKLIKVNDIPITFNGKLDCMIANILPAIITSWINGFSTDQIIQGLKSFLPSSDNLPGRYNFFQINGCEVMLDYAHNESAYIFLKKYLADLNYHKKVAIIAGTGDRRSIDITKTGFYAGEIFDEIIIRHDKDSRGRTNQEITELLVRGIHEANPNVKLNVISAEFDAVNYALDNAESGTFIWYFPDKILSAVNFLKKRQAKLTEKY